MRMTYDAKADEAYIALADDVEVEQSITGIQHPEGINPVDITLDLDSRGRLVGIKVRFAKEGLPPEFLGLCERIG